MNPFADLQITPRRPIPRNHPRRKRSAKNKTGIIGVYWQASYRGWVVTWGDACIKCTRDFFEACCIRKSMEANR